MVGVAGTPRTTAVRSMNRSSRGTPVAHPPVDCFQPIVPTNSKGTDITSWAGRATGPPILVCSSLLIREVHRLASQTWDSLLLPPLALSRPTWQGALIGLT